LSALPSRHVLIENRFDEGIHSQAAFSFEKLGEVRFVPGLIVIAQRHAFGDALVVGVL